MREPAANPRPANIIGIHLGATNSIVAHFNAAGLPAVATNAEGGQTTPSVVMFEESGAIVVGTEAKKLLGLGIPNVFAGFKREIGTEICWPVGKRKITPTDLTALLLKKLTLDYEQNYGAPHEVIIAWPANFRHEQREATMDAAGKAGLSSVRYIEEPVAAAFYFAAKSKLNGKYVIINLDGTALDVALVEVKGGEVTLLRQEGGLKIGTLNVDEALLEVLSEKFKSITGDYFDQTDCYFDRLSVSHTKENLISRPNCDVRLVSAKHGPLKVEITRQELEAKIKYLAHHVKIACENITQIGTKGQTEQTINEEVQEIFMIGDISLIPFMKEAVESFFAKKPKIENADQAIAMGAAVFGALMAPRDSLWHSQRIGLNTLLDAPIAPHFIGTSARDSDGSRPYNDIVIAKGTSLPCKIERSYFTTHENQTSFNFDVTQSAFAERDLDFVTKIWETSIKLPQGAPAGLPIKATFLCDMNGILSITIEIHGQSAGPCVTAKLLGPVPGELTP